MAQAKTTQWEGSRDSIFTDGECDVVGCAERPNHRRFHYPTCMNGDAECLASVCNAHKEYKTYQTTEQIIKASQN